MGFLFFNRGSRLLWRDTWQAVWKETIGELRGKFHIDDIAEGKIPGQNGHYYDVLAFQPAPQWGLYVKEYDENGNEVRNDLECWMMKWDEILSLLMEDKENLPHILAWTALVEQEMGDKDKARAEVKSMIEEDDRKLGKASCTRPVTLSGTKRIVAQINELEDGLVFLNAVLEVSQK